MADQNVTVPVPTINTGSGYKEVLAGGRGVDVGFDPDTILYINQLSPAPSNAYKIAINNLVISLKNHGVWNELDRLWIHATEAQQHARVSLVNPTSTVISESGTPTWTANQGYTGNGSSMYLNTNYNTLTSSVKFTQNSGSIGVYNRSNVSENRDDMGNLSASTANVVRSKQATGGSQVGALNQASGISIAQADARGLCSTVRTGAAAISLWKNGVSITSNTNASLTVPSLNLFVLALNSVGSPINYSTKQIAMSYVGSGIVPTLSLYTDFQVFATTRGFNV